jgi:pimeloyl-ACP methyl ester carboxylesterase
VRFSQLVGGAGTAERAAPRYFGELAAFLSRALGRQWGSYSLDQHIDDVIAFIEQLDAGPVDLMGHSRGGHVSFRVAQRRPDLLRKLILAEPGGEIDASLDPDYKPGPWPMADPIAAAAELITDGDIDDGLEIFLTALHVPWKRLPATTKQLLRDNATTLIGDARDVRVPFSKPDAESVRTPTLFIGGAATRGLLPKVLQALAAHVAGARTEMIAGATHAMFEQAPQRYCEIVLDFLGS